MNAIRQILEEERELTTLNISRLKLTYDFKSLYLTNSDGDLFLTVDSLIKLNNLITGSQHTKLRSCNVKPAGYNKQYMDVNKIDAALYGLIDDFNDRKITHREFVLTFLKYTLLQTETVELARFFLQTRLRIKRQCNFFIT